MYCQDSAANIKTAHAYVHSKPQVSVEFSALMPSSCPFFLTFSFPNLHFSSKSQITYSMEYTDPDTCPIMKSINLTLH